MPLPSIPHMKPPAGVQINPLHPLSKGLVGCWLFNEGAGSRANDISGHANHGTLTNMSTNAQNSGWSGSKFGGGLEFDGVNDYIDMSDPVIDYPATVSMWIKPDIITGADIAFYLYLDTGKWVVAGFYDINGWITNTANVSAAASHFTVGKWHHVVTIITSSNTGSVWVNGVDRTIVNPNAQYWGESGTISEISGRNHANTIDGSIDSVSIWERALPLQQIKQLHHDPFCNLLRVPVRYVPAAAGLPIPIAMNYYRRRRVA